MKLPSRIKVGYRTYSVIEWPASEATDADALGLCSNIQGLLKVRTDLPSQEKAQTLLHELFHAAWAIGDLGDRETEEKAVAVLAMVFAQIAGDNPELFPLISESLTGSA